MARGRPKRDWVKLWVQGCLRGSINYQLELDEQAVWFKLIMMSAVQGAEPGIISDNDGRKMPHAFIAQELHCSVELLESTLEKCIEEGRIKENSTGIEIVNFAEYQFTEYDRQKPYREEAKITFEEYIETLRPEYPELDIDKELKKFKAYWSEGNRILQRPKVAFHNWLDKAMEFKREKTDKEPQNRERRGSDYYTKGRFGHMVQTGKKDKGLK